MKLLQPLGLLGLIAIPILILIYFLKRKYQEHTISSSYLWDLSNQFLKKKRKIRKYPGLWSLILQIIAVILVSFSLAQPIFYTSRKAENICFILDASGSMNIRYEDENRFEAAKKEMLSMVGRAPGGSTYTLIYAGQEPQVVANKVDNKDVFTQLCKSLTPEYAHVSLASSIELANQWVEENGISKVVVLTDQTYQKVENAEVITFSQQEENYATYSLKEKQDKQNITFSGYVLSYESDATIDLELYLDEEFIETKSIAMTKGVENAYSFTLPLRTYQTARVQIKNEDALSLDNQDILYSIQEENQSSILLVSKSPFYLKSMISSIGEYKINIITPDQYQNQTGYDLFIFDGFTPSTLPTSGAIWFLKSNQNLDGTGFIVQDEKVMSPTSQVTYTEENSKLYTQLTQDIKHNSILVYKYMKYSIYRDFATVLQCDGLPLLFAGSTESGLREAVFAFDLQDSNLPLVFDFAPVMRNLLNYSLPSPIEDRAYVVGDSLQINISSRCENIRITSPSSKISFIPTSSQIAYFDLKEVGTYIIRYRLPEGEREYSVYASFPMEEGNVTIASDSLTINKRDEKEKVSGISDSLFLILLIACISILVEWGVYSREQY